MRLLRKPMQAFSRLSPRLKVVTIIGGGIFGLVLLLVFRPRPAAQEPPRRVPLVVTVPADVRSGNLTIRGSGNVRPRSEIVLSSQVAGRIDWVSPTFASGGRFRKGDPLLRIEEADYVNRVDAASAAVAQRRVEVLQWEEERELALEEYERLQAREGIEALRDTASRSGLIFREPQLQAARAALRSAEAQLEDARLALSRTRITAPFEGIIRSKSVDVGQYVAPGQNLGSLYATDEVEIVVPLTDGEASLVEGLWEAGAAGSETRIPATVRAAFGGRTYQWDAYVDRAEGALNPETRTVDVVVRVSDPFVTDGSERPPLLLGTYAEVDIQGAAREAYVTLPRMALRDGNAVYLVERDTLLVVRPVTLLQEVGAQVFVSADIEPGQAVVVSPMDIVTDSMTVQVANGGAR